MDHCRDTMQCMVSRMGGVGGVGMRRAIIAARKLRVWAASGMNGVGA